VGSTTSPLCATLQLHPCSVIFGVFHEGLSHLSTITPDSHHAHQETGTSNHSPYKLHLLLPGHLHLNLLAIHSVLTDILAATARFPAHTHVLALAHCACFSPPGLGALVRGSPSTLHILARTEAWEALEAVKVPFYALAAEERGERGPQQVGMFVALAGEGECGDQAERGNGSEGEAGACCTCLEGGEGAGGGGGAGEEGEGGESYRAEGVGCALAVLLVW